MIKFGFELQVKSLRKQVKTSRLTILGRCLLRLLLCCAFRVQQLQVTHDGDIRSGGRCDGIQQLAWSPWDYISASSRPPHSISYCPYESISWKMVATAPRRMRYSTPSPRDVCWWIFASFCSLSNIAFDLSKERLNENRPYVKVDSEVDDWSELSSLDLQQAYLSVRKRSFMHLHSTNRGDMRPCEKSQRFQILKSKLQNMFAEYRSVLAATEC